MDDEKKKIPTDEEILNKIFSNSAKYMSKQDQDLVKKGYLFAKYAHSGQKRSSGEPYISHPIHVAEILSDLSMDAPTVVSGFLHDVVEDTQVTYEDLVELFSKQIADIVEGVTKISEVSYHSSKSVLAENHRKLLLSMAKDPRVIMVKLADRLHNLRTLNFLPESKQKRIATETLEIYAPIAERLGISKIKWELEDTSLRYLDPESYYKIAKNIQLKRSEREEYIDLTMNKVTEMLDSLHIDYKITGRPKHIYSVYKKITEKNKDFTEVLDLLALRIIVPTIKDCYAVLGLIHDEFKPMPGRFKDYISVPKKNMYQSLHTTVFGPKGLPIEIQIRTDEMDRVAEYGVAAHWAYKFNEQNSKEDEDAKTLNIFKEILDISHESANANDFMNQVKHQIFGDRVYVFSPQGDVYELPKGSTPIDFAYAVHSAVGDRAVGAKVNGRIEALSHKLESRDIVEIQTQTNSTPKRDWLDFVFTPRARQKINRFLKAEEKNDDYAKGIEMLERGFAERGLKLNDFIQKLDEVAEKHSVKDPEKLIAQVGYGAISVDNMINQLTVDYQAEEDKRKEEIQIAKLMDDSNNSEVEENVKQSTISNSSNKNGISIEGIDNLLVNMARCCMPVPGDDIVGYVTMGNGVTVHRSDCSNIAAIKENQIGRLVDASFDNPNQTTEVYNVALEIFVLDRNGILSEILNVLNQHTKNIMNINGKTQKNDTVKISAIIGIYNKNQLDRLLANIKSIEDVKTVRRVQSSK